MIKKIISLFQFRKYLKDKSLSNLTKKLFIIFFFNSLFIDPFINYESQNQDGRLKKSIFKEIATFENSVNLSYQNFNEFRKINCDNKLIEGNQKFNKNENPEVSIIITIYNQAYDIHKSLRSVQNQSIKNIEIIIVDDCSLDNSLDIIKEYQKYDKRILLISHNSNEGTIKSRTDGIKKAKGKYITIIDGDDSLIHKDILKNCLYIAQKGNIDVVEFRGAFFLNGKFKGIVNDYNDINVENILYQPELRVKFFYKTGKYKLTLINRVIWGKFIKKNIFIELLNYIGSEYVNEYINYAEDCIMALGIYHIAKSYYVMKEIGYYYAFEKKKNSIKLNNNKVCKIMNDGINNFYFNYLKFMVDKHNKNKKEIRSAYNELLILKFEKILEMNLKKRHYQIIFYVLDKFLEWDCFRQKEKRRINRYKNLAIEKSKKDNITLII